MLLVSLLAVISPLGAQAAITLPPEFSVVVGSSGPQLVWTPAASSNTTAAEAGGALDANSAVSIPVVSVGGSRYEFRLPSGTIVGYPREANQNLVLSFTVAIQNQLLTEGGEGLQVWSSGRRLDSGAPPLPSSSAKMKASAGGKVSGSINAHTITPTPTIPVDPSAPGSYSIKRVSYDLRPRLSYAPFPAPIEVVAEVTYPNARPPAGGNFPLVLFLHGRHTTCFKGAESDLAWPCPTGWKPIPSHRGYRYVADILASQGYIAVSISANGINGQDDAASDGGAEARSLLIRRHLALWAQWNTAGGDPFGGVFKNSVDMSKVVLVGHSRGGEGVNRAAVDAFVTDPYKIVGLVSYGPTAFGFQVTPDIHSATILPTCDGDVFDLQGQAYIDSSRDIAYSPALRSAVIALGTNHNYYNTEWTPGLAVAPAWDDWSNQSDPVCGSDGGLLRLTPQEQQKVGAVYTMALVWFAVKRDVAMLPLLDGSYVRPAAIGRAEVATHAVGGAGYSLLYRPEDIGEPTLTKGMRGDECLGYPAPSNGSILSTCNLGNSENFQAFSPHWLTRTFESTHPAPQAMELRWTAKLGATASFAVPARKRDLSSLDWINVRIANDPKRASGARFQLLIQDRQGRVAPLTTSVASIEGWPVTGGFNKVNARALRGSLASVPPGTVNLKKIVAVLLVAQTRSGKVWVIDIAASKDEFQQPPVLNLPVLSVESLKVKEGNGAQTAKVKVISDRPLTSPGEIWVQSGSPFEQGVTGVKMNLAPGSSTVVGQIPFSWIGDTIYSPSQSISSSYIIGSISGVVTGNYFGDITVEEDETPPTLSVEKTSVEASEGRSLEWKFELSGPTGGFEVNCFTTTPPPGRTELRSNNVPTAWLRSSMWSEMPTTPTRLSELSVYANVRFDFGVTSASLFVPIASDGVAEGDEWVSFECFSDSGVLSESLTLSGKVRRSK